MVKKIEVSMDELAQCYDGTTYAVEAECEFTTPTVGGQPAGDKALAAFVQHYLCKGKELSDEEIEQEVARIKNEEIGERDTTGELDEINERKSYGLNVIRRDTKGPYLGTWMIKACLKNAASRIGLFVKKRGSKGDFAEMGKVTAIGLSKQGTDRRKIHLFSPDGKPAVTYYEEFTGSVSTPNGRTSIKHHSELAPKGTRFSFKFQVPEWGKIDPKDLKYVFASIMEIGIGSVKAKDHGKFQITKMTILQNKEDKPKKEKEKKEPVEAKA